MHTQIASNTNATVPNLDGSPGWTHIITKHVAAVFRVALHEEIGECHMVSYYGSFGETVDFRELRPINRKITFQKTANL